MAASTEHLFKGLTASEETFDGSDLRIAIVHARWNMPVIEPLVKGAIETLIQSGVKSENIVVENVSGSFELPSACSRLIAGSQVQGSNQATDLLGGMTNLLTGGNSNNNNTSRPATPITSPTSSSSANNKPSSSKKSRLTGPFNAVIAIGVLIKGSTMHFEYICESVSQGLMRVGLDTGIPIIFGVLTCLTEDQALERAGVDVKGKEGKSHNHGIDWGKAAVEMSVKTKRWGNGEI